MVHKKETGQALTFNLIYPPAEPVNIEKLGHAQHAPQYGITSAHMCYSDETLKERFLRDTKVSRYSYRLFA